LGFPGADLFGPVQRVERARRLGATVGRVYVGIKANQLLARRLSREEMRRRWSDFHRSSARSVYRTAVDLRGLVLKGCQYLGARADLMPREWVEVLSALQDRVPPRELRVVRRIVEEDLGRTLEGTFRRFETRPMAAASLAQVHLAELRDGRRVAVKVQYPEIAELVRQDLANLRTLFRAIDWLEPDLDLLPIVDELGRHVPLELDFRAEADAAERVARLLAHRRDVRVPGIHRELSTRRVLVMEFVEGVRITDREALAAAGADPQDVARTLVEVYAEQILVHGFFQADPHPGNLLVEPGGRLVLLDFGLAKELPPGFRADAAALLTALLRGDPEEMADCLWRLGFRTRDGSRDALAELARSGLALTRELALAGSLRPGHMERLVEELTERIRANPIVRIPSHVVLLARTLGLLSGALRSLGTRADPLRFAMPYLTGAWAPPVDPEVPLGAAPA
jgi:ubiquinone biosynthesis protein